MPRRCDFLFSRSGLFSLFFERLNCSLELSDLSFVGADLCINCVTLCTDRINLSVEGVMIVFRCVGCFSSIQWVDWGRRSGLRREFSFMCSATVKETSAARGYEIKVDSLRCGDHSVETMQGVDVAYMASARPSTAAILSVFSLINPFSSNTPTSSRRNRWNLTSS